MQNTTTKLFTVILIKSVKNKTNICEKLYDVSNKSECEKAVNYIYSTNLENNASLNIIYENNDIFNVLSYQMILFSSRLQSVFKFLSNNINNITVINNFILLWKILRHNQSIIEHIMSRSALWKPLLQSVILTLTKPKLLSDHHPSKYSEIADLWHVIIDTTYYWKKKHYMYTIDKKSKNINLSGCITMLYLLYFSWKKQEIYEASISANSSIISYLKLDWIIRGAVRFHVRAHCIGGNELLYSPFKLSIMCYLCQVMAIPQILPPAESNPENKYKNCKERYTEIFDQFWNNPLISDLVPTVSTSNRNLRKKCALANCRKTHAYHVRKCSGCKLVYYCSKRHQKKHWKFIHSKQCLCQNNFV
eukprot:449829_1